MTKVLLMILDGWGIGGGAADPADAISARRIRPIIESLMQRGARMPNSAPSAKTWGSPPARWAIPKSATSTSAQAAWSIRTLCASTAPASRARSPRNPKSPRCLAHAKASDSALHLMGLFSDGGVHASFEHLLAFIDLARKAKGSEKVFVHAFMDGRDTDPKSGLGIRESALRSKLSAPGREGSQLASMIGRYYAMDRDKRWERIEEA